MDEAVADGPRPGAVPAMHRAIDTAVQRRWALGVWLIGVVCLLAMVMPAGTPAHVILLHASNATAVLVMLWAAVRMPPGARAVWWSLWVYVLLTASGDVVYDVYQYHWDMEPFPSAADGLYFASYLALITALVILVHRRQSGHNRETWIDTAVMTLAAACLVATVVVVPMLNDSGVYDLSTAMAVAYPLLDVVALSVMIRLLIDVERMNLALSLVAVAIALTLTADLVFQSLVAQGVVESAPSWVDVLYLASNLLIAAAATARGAAGIARRARSTHRTKVRLIGLAVAALTAPSLLAYSVWSEVGSGARLLAVASIAVILLILWGSLILISMVEQQSALLADLARRDGLTGLPNRRTWDFALGRAADRSAEQGIPLTVAMLDLDHFKAYNDRHGHPEGDNLLMACARAWAACLAPPALLARYGGEEFAALMPGFQLDDARPVLDRLRAATPVGQTVSIGCAERAPDEPIVQTLQRADQALYTAKSSGRDRVVAHQPDRLEVEA